VPYRLLVVIEEDEDVDVVGMDLTRPQWADVRLADCPDLDAESDLEPPVVREEVDRLRTPEDTLVVRRTPQTFASKRAHAGGL
jgi:hypothetical protein